MDYNNTNENQNMAPNAEQSNFAASHSSDPSTPYQTPVRGQTPPPASQQAQQTGYTTYQQPTGQSAYQQPSHTTDYTQPPYNAYQTPSNGGYRPPRKKHGHAAVITLCSIAGACLLFAGGAAIGGVITNASDSSSQAAVSDQSGPAANAELPTVSISETPAIDPENYDTVNGLAGEEVYKKANPSIVSVVATNMETGGGSGSGVIMTADGYVITNNHVIEDAQQVSVVLSDGSTVSAEIVGADSESDLAVLKLNTDSALTPAEFGDSDQLEPGEYCYALGSPGGVTLANTITGGRISAINRNITINDRVMTVIQTDASINPGNSGGALINKYGQVVGITSAKLMSAYYTGETYEGLGFAIPINTAKTIVDELIANGYVSGRPSIGITGYDITEQMTQYSQVPQGVYVVTVDENAAANSEGLMAQDIITGVNGKEITTMDEINSVKEDLKAGDKIELTVYRMSTGKTLTLSITLTDEHDLAGTSPEQQQQQQPSSNYGNYGNYGNNGGNSQNPFSSFFGY